MRNPERVNASQEEFAVEYLNRILKNAEEEIPMKYENFVKYVSDQDVVETSEGPLTRSEIKQLLVGLHDEKKIDQLVDGLLDEQELCIKKREQIHGDDKKNIAGFGKKKTTETSTEYRTEMERLNAIKSSGIMIQENNDFGFDGYTAEQHTDMLSQRSAVLLGKTVTSLALEGDANSVADLLYSSGYVKQRRIYGPGGKAVIDYDTDNHGKPKYHPTGAHKHFYNHQSKKTRGKPLSFTAADLTLNSDIVREGDNYFASKIGGSN